MTPNTPVRRSLWPWISLPAASLFALLGASLGLAQDPPKAVELTSPSVGNRSSSVTAPSTGKDSGGAKPDRDGSKPSTDNQISLLVRLVTAEAPTWRGPLKDKMREVHHDPAVTAWIVQEKAVQDLISILQKHPTSNIRQAPRLTTFEAARATIKFYEKEQIIDDIQKLRSARTPGFHHIAKPVELASQVDLVGKIRPGSVMLTVDHFRTTLMPTLDGAAQANRGSSGKSAAETEPKAGNDWAPGIWTNHIRVEQDVPEKTSLLIRMGQEAFRREKPAAAGGPPVTADLITRENLVLITPVTIRLEPEERPAVSTSDTKPHPKPSRTTRL